MNEDRAMDTNEDRIEDTDKDQIEDANEDRIEDADNDRIEDADVNVDRIKDADANEDGFKDNIGDGNGNGSGRGLDHGNDHGNISGRGEGAEGGLDHKMIIDHNVWDLEGYGMDATTLRWDQDLEGCMGAQGPPTIHSVRQGWDLKGHKCAGSRTDATMHKGQPHRLGPARSPSVNPFLVPDMNLQPWDLEGHKHAGSQPCRLGLACSPSVNPFLVPDDMNLHRQDIEGHKHAGSQPRRLGPAPSPSVNSFLVPDNMDLHQMTITPSLSPTHLAATPVANLDELMHGTSRTTGATIHGNAVGRNFNWADSDMDGEPDHRVPVPKHGNVLIYETRDVCAEPLMSVSCTAGEQLPGVLCKVAKGYSPIQSKCFSSSFAYVY